MRVLLRTIILGAVAVFMAFPLAARAESLAAGVQKAYAAVGSMRAEFTQRLAHKESGAVENRSGVLLFKKPLLVRWETKKPSPELLIVGSDAIWNVFPDEELAYKYSTAVAEDSGGIIRVVTGQVRLDQDYDLEDEKREGDLLTVRLYPKQPSQALVEALLWVDPSTYLIKKIKVYDFYGNENEIAFTGQQPGAAVKDASFAYTPPADFLIEDRSKDSALQKPLLQ